MHYLPCVCVLQPQNFCLVLFLSLVKYSSCSLILFLGPLNCLSEFSCSLLSFFRRAILNSLYVRPQHSVTLSLVFEELLFSFCATLFLQFFMVLRELFLCLEVANIFLIDSELPLVVLRN